MTKLSAALACVLLAGPSAPAFSGAAGEHPFNFLFLDANARPVAMGGAYTALASDVNAMLYNPAGLAYPRRYEATFMHNSYFQDIRQEYLAVASDKGWGGSFNYLDFGDVQRASISNPAGTGLGSAGMTDLALAAGYGREINGDLSAGAAVKFISESIDGVSGRGYAVDLGVLYSWRKVKGLTFGAAVQNLGPAAKFQKESFSLPLNLRLGSAYLFEVAKQKSAAVMDITKAAGESAVLAFGVETLFADALYARLGYNGRNDAGSGLSAGVGWAHKDLSVDYAMVSYGELGLSHRLSFTLKWNAAVPRKPAAGAPAPPAAPVPGPEPASGPAVEPSAAPAPGSAPVPAYVFEP